MSRRVLVGFGVDVDAVAGWLGSYGGEDSPLDISRGMYAGEVGVPRLLKLFDKYQIKATWFIPGMAFHFCSISLFIAAKGHSLETFPEQMAAVRDAGHEIGMHGYSHENPISMTPEQQKVVLDYTYDLLTEFNNGKPPKGYVAPWWETSKEGTDLLLDKGIEYDHSNMAHDSQMYYLRDQDKWTKIDYSAPAHTWMKPLERGKQTGLVEIPANWSVQIAHCNCQQFNAMQVPGRHDTDDLTFGTGGNVSNMLGGYVVPDYQFHREEQDFVFPLSIHPDVSGRPHVLMMVERFIEWINTHENVHWVRMIDMVQEFRAKNKPDAGAKMPAGVKAE
ncbi:hypothetical protein JAAARDRAFT_193830 [Jaapia argillacea MUCL 33604]|uniref:NodB homology domain-containing protein n=1 Tax=Jaapia argillacea MUCL 33604 TaxID=933084 RepID=A0A067PS06_9AGAM|nr:hypothetical protein JAAARDRAFT_193830 [Jaapia argillacea MUCL 33604]